MKTHDHLRLPRSAEWEHLRNRWIKDHPTCAACGGTKHLEVHHKVPVHVSRSMELDPNNLITLCEAQTGPATEAHCHFTVGHLGNWFNYNRNVEKQSHDMLLAKYPRPLNAAESVALTKMIQPTPTGDNPARASTLTTPDPEVITPLRFRRNTRR
jgi:hypothetical protein